MKSTVTTVREVELVHFDMHSRPAEGQLLRSKLPLAHVRGTADRLRIRDYTRILST